MSTRCGAAVTHYQRQLRWLNPASEAMAARGGDVGGNICIPDSGLSKPETPKLTMKEKATAQFYETYLLSTSYKTFPLNSSKTQTKAWRWAGRGYAA